MEANGNEKYHAMACALNIHTNDELFGEDWLDSYLSTSFLMPNMKQYPYETLQATETSDHRS